MDEQNKRFLLLALLVGMLFTIPITQQLNTIEEEVNNNSFWLYDIWTGTETADTNFSFDMVYVDSIKANLSSKPDTYDYYIDSNNDMIISNLDVDANTNKTITAKKTGDYNPNERYKQYAIRYNDGVTSTINKPVLSENTFTIELDAYVDNYYDNFYDPILMMDDSSGDTLIFFNYNDEDPLLMIVYMDGNLITLEANKKTGEWLHYTIVVDVGNSIKLYENGILVDSASCPSGTFDWDDIVIGSTPPSYPYDDNLDGKVSNIRIWNDTRNQTEINQYLYSELSGDENNLISYYPYVEGTGTTLYDYAGNNNATTDSYWIQEYISNPNSSNSVINDTDIYNITINNSGDYDLIDYAVKIDGSTLGITSTDESWQITDVNETGGNLELETNTTTILFDFKNTNDTWIEKNIEVKENIDYIKVNGSNGNEFDYKFDITYVPERLKEPLEHNTTKE